MQAEGVVQVFKRGRARKDGTGEAMCVLTMEVVQNLGRLPLPAAADTLGISATALKGACRKLGISRWPYFAGRGMHWKQKEHQAQAPRTQNAGTQTDLSFGGASDCPLPALVDAEGELHEHDVLAVWCD